MTTTPGRKFYDQHVSQISAGKIDEMVDNDYKEDAVFITFFNGFETPAPITVKGRDGLKKFFHDYMKVISNVDVKTLDLTEDFNGNQGYIFLQATFNCNLGLIKAGDAWTMKDGQITEHFSFWVSDKS